MEGWTHERTIQDLYKRRDELEAENAKLRAETERLKDAYAVSQNELIGMNLQLREARELIEFMRQHLDGNFLCDGNDACTCIEHSAVRFLEGCAEKPVGEPCYMCHGSGERGGLPCPECAQKRVDPVPKLATGFCRCYCHAGGSGASSAYGCCSYSTNWERIAEDLE
ncbi:MAG: hypothetical protein MN733_38450 [Nitrososphaera sp.]|nr:hypothetical protein [Nitrososphaera sp.]